MKAGRLKLVVSICLALLLVILSLTMACAKPAPEVKTLKVGVLASLTGPMSDIETMMRDGALLAMDWINDKGGVTVNGQQYMIELIVEDAKSSADGTIAGATKLVEQDKVKFIIGGITVFMHAAAAQVCEPAKVLRSVFNMTGLPEELSPDTPYLFRAMQCGGEKVPGLFDYLLESYPDVKTVACMGADEPGDRFFADIGKKEAQVHGLTMTAIEFFPWGTEDFYPVWTKVLATKPDAVYFAGQPINVIASELKQGRELGFKGPCFTDAPGDLYITRDIVGKTAATDFFNSSIDLSSPEMTPMLKEVEKLWQAKYGTPLQGQTDSLCGWDSLWAIVQAIEEAQSLDPTVVAQTWENMSSIETAYGGPGKMGGEKTYGINHVVVSRYPICRLHEGEVEHVGWYTLEVP